MVDYKARGVPCGFRTCIRWLALDRLLMISAAEFTIHGDINIATSQIRQAAVFFFFFAPPYMVQPYYKSY
jgi:hypothetical protein